MNENQADTSKTAQDCRLAVHALVIQDIVDSMRTVVESKPIRNDSSYALKILWDIYEESADYFEMFKAAMALTDDEIEQVFNKSFHVFIAEYPKVMVLDR